jgi:hypothetical protein
MRKLILISLALAPFGATAALAGGMGDPSANLKMKNAICEMQKRGEGPLYPNLCLEELPATPVEAPQRRRMNKP